MMPAPINLHGKIQLLAIKIEALPSNPFLSSPPLSQHFRDALLELTGTAPDRLSHTLRLRYPDFRMLARRVIRFLRGALAFAYGRTAAIRVIFRETVFHRATAFASARVITPRVPDHVRRPTVMAMR